MKTDHYIIMERKVIYVAIAALISLSQFVKAQSSVDSLKVHCVIYPSAKFVLEKAGYEKTPNIKMSEFNGLTDEKGVAFGFEMLLIYQWNHMDIPLNNVANDTWAFVSNQLHGESGLLTKESANFIPTRNPMNSPVLLIIIWDNHIDKWKIMSVYLSQIKSTTKGVRMFAK